MMAVSQQLVWSILTILMAAAQFVGIVASILWLRKRYQRKRLSPPPADSRSAFDSLFLRHSNLKLKPNDAKVSLETFLTEENGLLNPEWEPLLLADPVDQSAIGRYQIEEQMKETAASGDDEMPHPKAATKDFLVLPVYYRFLQLQALHCFLWVGLAVFVVAQGSDLVEWGESAKSRVNTTFIVCTSLLLAVHAALIDGVQLFLTQPSVGSMAIRKCFVFALLWACLNGGALCITSTLAGNSTNYDQMKFNQLPWWDPFFLRTCIVFVFNSSLHFYRFCAERRQEASNSNWNRKCWIKLSWFNILMSLLLILLYICDFFAEKAGDFWASLVAAGFLVFFMFYTPLLYKTLMNDSRYWRGLWRGEIQGISTSALLDFSAFSYENVLGSGGFATVWRGRLWSQLPVAIKVIHVSELSTEVVESFIAEVRTLSMLEHPNVVQFVGACIDPPDLAIAMELCDDKSLAARIRSHSRRKGRLNHSSALLFTEKEISSIGTAIAQALQFMHGKGILHRDLKSANVLFDAFNGIPKVCDFGLAQWLSKPKEDSSIACCGTPGYIAPEVLRNGAYSTASDVFALGLILWEMVRERMVWRTETGMPVMAVDELLDRMAHHNFRPSMNKIKIRHDNDSVGGMGADGCRYISKKLYETILGCWDDDPDSRPSINTLVWRLQELSVSS